MQLKPSVVQARRHMVRRALSLAAIAILLIGCGAETLRDHEIPVKAPFSRASVYGSRLFVRLVSGAALESAVTIRLGPLRGGMTLDEAVPALGEPVATRRDDRGTYFSFGGIVPPSVENG